MQTLFNYLNTTSLDQILNTMKKLQVAVKKVDNNYLFNYEDEAPRGNPIVDGCRGTIWQHDPDTQKWTCLRAAMDRFFNLDEQVDGLDTSVLPGPMIVQEKLDGTLALLYWNGKSWTVGTRNVFDCTDISVRGSMNMRKVFDSVTTLNNLSNEMKNYTFLFELCSPYNQVVVYHPESSVNLLSVRSTIYPFPELDPFCPSFSSLFPKVNTPKKFEFTDLNMCRDYVEKYGGASFEGMVLVQGTVETPRRLKLKSKSFVSLAHSPAGNVQALPEEQILSALLKGSNEVAELLTYYSWHAKVDQIRNLLQTFRSNIAETQKLIDALDKPTKGEIASIAKKSVCPNYFFAIGSNKTKNLDEYLKGLDGSALLKIIGYSS